MIDPLRRTLTQLGALAAHPLAFLILVAYGDMLQLWIKPARTPL